MDKCSVAEDITRTIPEMLTNRGTHLTTTDRVKKYNHFFQNGKIIRLLYHKTQSSQQGGGAIPIKGLIVLRVAWRVMG